MTDKITNQPVDEAALDTPEQEAQADAIAHQETEKTEIQAEDAECHVVHENIPQEVDAKEPQEAQEILAEALPPQPSAANKLFQALSYGGWLVLTVCIAAVALPSLILHHIPLSTDQGWLDLLQQIQGHGSWLFFSQGDATITSLPPLYFWFLAGLQQLLFFAEAMPALSAYIDASWLMQGSAVLSLWLCVMCTWLLARGLGLGRAVAFAAGCMVMLSLLFMGANLYADPILLFTSLFLLSLLMLYRGWIKANAPCTLILGFILAGAATLTLSPFGAVVPLLTSLLFLLWRGTFRRAGQRDGALGFALLLILTVGWFTLLAITPSAKPYLVAIVEAWRPLSFSDALQAGWFSWISLAIISLPWIGLLLFAPWERILYLPATLWKARHQNPGSGWLWISLLCSLALIPFMPESPLLAALPLVPLVSIAAAQGLVGLAPWRSRLFFGIIGIVLCLLGIVLSLAASFPHMPTFVPSSLLSFLDSHLALLPFAGDNLTPIMPLLEAATGLYALAGILFVAGLVLLKGTQKRWAQGSLLVVTFWMLFAIASAFNLTMPSLHAYWNPAPSSEQTQSEQVAPEQVVPKQAQPESTTPIDMSQTNAEEPAPPAQDEKNAELKEGSSEAVLPPSAPTAAEQQPVPNPAPEATADTVTEPVQPQEPEQNELSESKNTQ